MQENLSQTILIGICGYAGSGKDYFAEKLISELNSSGNQACRAAFADKLKNELNNFLLKKMQISAWTKIPQEKKIIRPMLVAYGETQRSVNHDHWIKKVEPTVSHLLSIGVTTVVTDVRYQNEAQWLKGKGGYLVHINRDGIPAPNESERKNLPLVKTLSDFKVDWPTTDSDFVLNGIVEEFVKELKKKHESRLLKISP